MRRPRNPEGPSTRTRGASLATSGLLIAVGLLAAAPTANASTASGGMTFATTSAATAAPAESPAPPATGEAAPASQTAPTVPVTRTVPLTKSQTKSVQRRVKVRPDGVLGSRTRVALRRYQGRRALKRTGRPNLQTLRAMKLGFAEKIAARMSTAGHAATPSVVAGHTFPILGAWRFGGAATVFGASRGHQGNDMFAACGTPIVAASAGTVKVNKSEARAGNYVVITDTPSGEDHVYMHMESRSTLTVDTPIAAGGIVGYVGDTGRASGCHLHFEIWTAPGWYSGGSARDPRKTLTAWAAASGTKPDRRAGL